MQIEFITKEDLLDLKKDLAEIKTLLKTSKPEKPSQYLRSKDVQKRLGGISSSSLKHLRDTGKLSHKKIGEVFFYEEAALEKLMQ